MREVRCKRQYAGKDGKVRVCNKKLGEFSGQYRVRCPRCHAIVSGDAQKPESQKTEEAE